MNGGVLIFVDLVVHINHGNKNSTKYNFAIDCWVEMIETTNLKTHGSMHFVGTTKLVPTNKSTVNG
jgi:hypothetical protein